MTLDVVIPALRRHTIEALLESLALNTDSPDCVTIVGEEIPCSVETYGLPVRLLRFRSARYPIGDCDVALRRDVGIWFSECSHVVTLDDDLVAPRDLVETSRAILEREPYFWGHYRFVDFQHFSLSELSAMPPSRGRSRERAPNVWHLWMSCYGGLFGGARSILIDHGGFDVGFSGRHASEDQAFGKRLATGFGHGSRAFIHEPPFAWHPTRRPDWGPRAHTNICPNGHELFVGEIAGTKADRCTRCPWFHVLDTQALFASEPLLRFDADAVTISITSK